MPIAARSIPIDLHNVGLAFAFAFNLLNDSPESKLCKRASRRHLCGHDRSVARFFGRSVPVSASLSPHISEPEQFANQMPQEASDVQGSRKPHRDEALGVFGR